MKVHLKDEPEVEFDACTYWNISDAIPMRHYEYVTNYTDMYSKKILEKHSIQTYGNLETNTHQSYACDIEGYNFTLILSDLNKIDSLATLLYEIGQEEYLYALNLSVEYNYQKVNIIIKKNIQRIYILKN